MAPLKFERWKWAIAAVVVGIFGAVGFYQAPLPFVRSWWDSDKYLDPLRVRNRMADGLILSGQLIGRRREEIVSLLGEPPPTHYMRDWNVVYDLGVERGFIAIDDEWLVIRVGPNGRVTEARILTD